MSQITGIETRPFRLPLRGSLSWGKHGHLSQLEHVLVQVTTASGHQGIAEAPVRTTIYGETVKTIEAIIADVLAPTLIGVDCTDVPTISDILWTLPNNYAAKGALDIALADAAAKTLGKSLLEHVGGSRSRIEVSYILGISDDIESAIQEALRVARAGVYVFKIKVGRDSTHDRVLIQALQQELSDYDITLYADANELLEAETAAHDLDALVNLGIAYIEEPIPIQDIQTRMRLREANILPIIADDACFTYAALERELTLNTFDILNIKPARTGVYTSLKMIEFARQAGKKVMIGSQASSGLGTLHAAVLASNQKVTYPSELSFPLKLHKDSIETSFTYQDGYLLTSQLENINCLL
ncbi:MAG: enolase C-terminal domain-like protein [Deinococcota bacterium]